MIERNKAAAVENGLRFAAEAGFSFTEAQFIDATTSTGGLSKSDLEGVSGGIYTHIPYDLTQTPGGPGFSL